MDKTVLLETTEQEEEYDLAEAVEVGPEFRVAIPILDSPEERVAKVLASVATRLEAVENRLNELLDFLILRESEHDRRLEQIETWLGECLEKGLVKR